MKWTTSLNAGSNARRALPKLAEGYFEAGREAAGGKRSSKAMHRFRISTKRFRYALELFEPVYGTSLERRLKVLKKLQDALGKISDCQTILEMLNGDKAVKAKLERAMKRNSKEFRRQWEKFDSNGQLKHWKSYLASGTARKPAPANK
jgi:CHAD domain-containing protein